MKKPFPIFISILTILAAAGIVSTNASTVEVINGERWWTIGELVDVVSEMETEAESKCGEDYACRKTFYKSLIATDPEKKTANVFSGLNFIISEVVPAEQRIQFLFQGRARLQYRNSTNQQNYIQNMYIGWLDEEDWETVGGDSASLLAGFQDKVGGKVHILYEGNLEEGNVLGPDEYLDLEVGEEFGELNGRIYYILQYTNGAGVWGSLEFKNIQSGEEIEETKEYEMKIGESTGFGLVEKADDDDDNNNDNNNDDGNSDNATVDDETSEVVENEEMGLIDNEKPEEDGGKWEILAPDTGIIKKS